MQTNRRIVYIITLVAVMLLSACGFQLRGSNGQADLPFKTVYLKYPESSSFGIELKRYVVAGGTRVVTDPQAAEAIIEPLSESRDKVILSLNAQGRIREFSLIYKVRFRVKDSKDNELLAPTEISLKRDVSYNETQAIAKEKEEELLYKDMQTDSIQQILRRLAVLKPAQ